jgi:hypothetical protein
MPTDQTPPKPKPLPTPKKPTLLDWIRRFILRKK